MSDYTIKPVSVTYTLVDGTATHGDDFEKPWTGTVVIPASTATTGPTSGTISISIRGDKEPEGVESFQVVLSNPVNATIADGTGVVASSTGLFASASAKSSTVGPTSMSGGAVARHGSLYKPAPRRMMTR